MSKLTLEDLQINGKRVLMRVDFNVPLDGNGNVTDPTRIISALPSIQYALDQGGMLILMSHLGRPHGAPDPELSMKPVAKVLESFLGKHVKLSPNCIGEETEKCVQSLQKGELLLLENLRFHRAEMHPEEDANFAKQLASFGDLYVNDAFGTAHRQHSSTYTIAQYFPAHAAAGYLMQKEIYFLGDKLENPKRPFCAILGGAKVSTKIGVIKSLLKKVDYLLIGGAMAYTFLKAQGIDIGYSLIEEKFIPLAHELLQTFGEKIILPLDSVVASECSEKAQTTLIEHAQEGIPKDQTGLDIGPKTIELFGTILSKAKMVLWNGPLGVYEIDAFAKGTQGLAKQLGDLEVISIAGGGDLIAALNQMEVSDRITHISTGGGAMLEYLEYHTLPCIQVLSNTIS